MNERKSPLPAIEAVVFDFDGTLAELHLDFGHMRAAILDLLGSYGLQSREFEHLYLLEMIEAGERRVAESAIERGKAFRTEAMLCIERMEVQAARQSRLYDGVKGMLSFIRNESILTGIITRNCHRAVETVFPDYTRYVDALLSREMTRRVKPDPGHLAELLAHLQIDADRVLMVGDHPIDIQVGKKLGTYTAAVLTGTGKPEELQRAQPDFLMGHVLEILDIIPFAHQNP
ncbi:MAG: HAD family hydrolase [Syntrophales bacterium]|jgi:phosphoglycolate phosphatase|nr:HAD family hydrolase [Syntrophales bacterium]